MDNSNYSIIDCDEAFLMEHAADFSALCVRAFAEHANRDVRMGPCTMTVDKWKNWVTGCIAQCMIENGKMIAFWLVRPNSETKEVDGRILAVDPKYKGQHLGTSLSLSLSRALRSMGMNVFHTDTSMKAPHVIKFHQSYGCKKVGMASWSNTNYYSVLLRLALNPEFEISDEEAERSFRHSARLCKLKFNEDGSKTIIGKCFFILEYSKLIVLSAINKMRNIGVVENKRV